MSFFSELKRRNVVRMGMLYVVASWFVLQIADVFFDPLGVPGWAFRMVLALLALGLPFVLVFAWIFELTPEGLKREKDIDRSQSVVRQTGQRMNVVIIVLLVLAIGGLVADRLIPEQAGTVAPDSMAVSATPDSAPPDAVVADERSIAVLPFVNMSGDPENEYFSDGLTEELLNTLVRMGGLKVTGRTSSFAFKGQNTDLREIGRMLHVANVLEGSVRKAGNRVRITAQLVKTSDGYHLWSETFDRELDDIFDIQAEIAGQVTSALKAALLGAESAVVPDAAVASSSRNAQAYEEYLRGMFIWQRQPDDADALARARGHFERALEIDPEYLEAHWGMFQYWDRMNRNGHVAFTESLAQMDHYTRELQRLAPGSELALNAQARNAWLAYEYEQSADYLEEAANLFPGSAGTLGAYATVLQVNANYEQANETVDRALELDPLSLEIMRWKAFIAMRTGNCDEVEQVMNRALEIEPGVGRFRAYLALCFYEHGGDVRRALPYAEDEPLAFLRDTTLAIFHHKLGDQEKAQAQLDRMYVDYGDSASYQYGQVHAQWGDHDTAIAWLENALLIRDPGLVQAGSDRLLDPLRDHPRFQELMVAAGHR
ncbi:MAG: hypothetical protein KJO33_05340 [Gammaproteobacteria bacterium]|nr:hypothetical protein [Gammaproteobacteria bacterium]MBT8064776.1 hypothetical protein [Gammaproteobacteria bacterium]NNK31487.1 hypothetical protein [Xanthomonadales bacterium]